MTDPIKIIRVEHSKENPYFMMNRDTAQDKSLSWEARGVLAYLLSKPDDWQVMVIDLQQNCGRDKVRHILDELKGARYLQIIPDRNEKGKFSKAEYRVYEKPFTENPTTDIPLTGLPTTGNPATVKHPLQSIDKQNTEKQKKDNAPNGAEPPIEIVKSIPSRKVKWADEDCLIDVWADIRQLDAIAMGADYHTDSDRKKAKKMLAWTKPITHEEIRDVMKASKYKGGYPFAFLEKDILEMRAKKAISAPAEPVVDLTPDARPTRIMVGTEWVDVEEYKRQKGIAS